MRIRDLELCNILYLINKKYFLPHEINVIIIKITRVIEKNILIEKNRIFHQNRLINPLYGVMTPTISYARSLKKILADDFRRNLDKKALISLQIRGIKEDYREELRIRFVTNLYIFYEYAIYKSIQRNIHKRLLKKAKAKEYHLTDNVHYFQIMYENIEMMVEKLINQY